MTGQEHVWMLTSPWYRLDPEGLDPAGRGTRPIFQKYASADLVNDFLAEPQRSLKYLEEDTANSALDPFSGSRRKIFLHTHSRFYLVVCELHCDTAGFPIVRSNKVAEAGFVVRRWKVPMTDEIRLQVQQQAGQMVVAQTVINGIQNATTKTVTSNSSISTLLAKGVRVARDRQLKKQRSNHLTYRKKLKDMILQEKIEAQLQGWHEVQQDVQDEGATATTQVPVKGIGQWKSLESETPEELEEQYFPLYPLTADPTDPSHSATNRSIWFGMLPIASSDNDTDSMARFDDRTLYTVSCFVRRRNPDCPTDDRSGQLVWSLPTEPYQLASHSDLVGTSNKPVTIQMPDLNQLKDAANSLSFGQGAAGVQVATPIGSSLDFTPPNDDTLMPKKGSAGGDGFEICFFAIPLITIVAMFLLRLILPIVVFLFGLWFLLKLKFCIPPSFSLDVDLTATLKADLDLELDFDAKIKGEVFTDFSGPDPAPDPWPEVSPNNLGEFEDFLRSQFNQLHPKMPDAMKTDMDNGNLTLNELGQLAGDMATDFSQGADEKVAGVRPQPVDRLIYHARKELPAA